MSRTGRGSSLPSTPERRDPSRDVGFTQWILNFTSKTHKCTDLHLFRTPKPQPPASSTSSSSGGRPRSTVIRARQRGQVSSSGSVRAHSVTRPRRNPLRRGTVVLPVFPDPRRTLPFLDVSVMTLSNVLYTPGKKYSELSWKVLEQQGFTRHLLHDHMYEVTRGSSRGNARRHQDGNNRLRIAGGLVSLEERSRQGRTSQRGSRSTGEGRVEPRCIVDSVIRHPAIPGVDLLFCLYDAPVGPSVIFVRMGGVTKVDLRAWSWGVENGVVGKGADFNARDANADPVAWVVRYGGNSPDEEPEEGDIEDLFRKIVQGGLSVGKTLVREMGMGGRG